MRFHVLYGVGGVLEAGSGGGFAGGVFACAGRGGAGGCGEGSEGYGGVDQGVGGESVGEGEGGEVGRSDGVPRDVKVRGGGRRGVVHWELVLHGWVREYDRSVAGWRSGIAVTDGRCWGTSWPIANVQRMLVAFSSLSLSWAGHVVEEVCVCR